MTYEETRARIRQLRRDADAYDVYPRSKYVTDAEMWNFARNARAEADKLERDLRAQALSELAQIDGEYL